MKKDTGLQELAALMQLANQDSGMSELAQLVQMQGALSQQSQAEQFAPLQRQKLTQDLEMGPEAAQFAREMALRQMDTQDVQNRFQNDVAARGLELGLGELTFRERAQANNEAHQRAQLAMMLSSNDANNELKALQGQQLQMQLDNFSGAQSGGGAVNKFLESLPPEIIQHFLNQ